MAWSCEDCTYFLYVWLALRVAATLRPFRAARHTPCRRRRRSQCYQGACCRTTTKPRFCGALTVVVVRHTSTGRSTPWLFGRFWAFGLKAFGLKPFTSKFCSTYANQKRQQQPLIYTFIHVYTTTKGLLYPYLLPSYVQEWQCK